MTRWLAHSVVVALALCGLAAPARADKVDPAVQAKADLLFEKAQADYQAGSYQAAIELFKQAFEEVHDPVYLFNVAQSYRKVLDCEAAFDYYQRYLKAAPNAENKDKVIGWLRELTPCVEQRKHEHEEAQKGEQAERDRKAEEARKREAAAAAATPAPVGEHRGRKLELAGIATASGGGVAMIVGIVFAVKGSHVTSEITSTCFPPAPMRCNWDSGPNSLDSTGHRDNVIAYVGFGIGAAAIAAGATMYVLGRLKLEHVAVTPVESGGGAAIAVRLTF